MATINNTDVISYITENTTEANLKKIEYQDNYYELLMEVNFENLNKLKQIISGLTEKNAGLQISVMTS